MVLMVLMIPKMNEREQAVSRRRDDHLPKITTTVFEGEDRTWAALSLGA